MAHVLLAGAGCTGALTAACLRHEAAQCGQQIHLFVWEWGRGPAGRMSSFWVDVDGQRVLADVGAQVISLRTAERLPRWLAKHLIPAEPAGLANTDERCKDWHHYFAPAGLAALQRASLEEANPQELHFNRRLVELNAGSSRRWRAGYASEAGGRRPAAFQEFDAVIFASTAQDACNLEGLRSALAPIQLRALKSVTYDHRVCVALILKPDIASHVERLCQGRAELAFADSGPIALISRQEVKGRAVPENDCSFAVVLHGTPAFAARNLQNAKSRNRPPSELGKQALLECFASLLCMSTQSLQSKVIDSKTVHWRQCQVRRGFPTNLQSEPCLIAGAASHLLLAGDYMACRETAGSFEGCLDSAEATARAMCCALLGETDATSLEAPAMNAEASQHDASVGRSGRWKPAPRDIAEAVSASKNEPVEIKGRRWTRKLVES